MYVDSHCHLDRLSLEKQTLDDIVQRATDKQVEHILCVAVSVKDFEQMYQQVKRFNHVSVSCGVHPLHHEDVCSAQELLKFCRRPEVVAVGETGLDYHYSAETRELQMASFVDHIKVANEVNKPLIIHTRAAQDDTLTALENYYKTSTGAVLHCFTESYEMAMAAIEMGIYISISGIVSFKTAKELQAVVKQIPLEKLLIETDSPWLAPVPHRGQENRPEYVTDVAQFIADLKGIPVEKLAKATTSNFYQLFSAIK